MTDRGWTGAQPNLPAVIAPTVGNDPDPARALTRDTAGRFLAGNGGGGRRKGSRNKLTETFLAAVASDFEQHGAATLAKLRDDDPASYLRIVGSFVPRESPTREDFGDLSDEEILERIERAERHSLVLKMIQAGENHQ